MTTKVEGLDRLKKKLAALPKKMKAEVIVALEKGADEVVNLARRLAPDGKPDDAQDLRSSIEKRPGEHELKILVVVGSGHGKAVEFGTAPHAAGGLFKGKMHPGTPPQPYLIPAFRTVKKRVKGRVKRAISKAAKAAVRG